VNKQREQYVEDKELETAIKGLEDSMKALTRAETEEVRNLPDEKTKSISLYTLYTILENNCTLSMLSRLFCIPITL